MGDGESILDALRPRATENPSKPILHPRSETFHDTHPPIPKVVINIREQAGTADSGSDDPAATNTD